MSSEVVTKRNFSLSPEYGLVVAGSKWSYVSRAPKEDSTHSNTYKVVNTNFLLKYIDGKVEIAELERNSRSLERREARMENITRMKEELGCQKQQVDELILSMSYWKNGYQSLHSKIARLQDWWLVRIIDRLFFGGHLAFVRDRAENPDVFLKKFSM